MNTNYTIHGVAFPVDSIDGLPDLYSVAALLNTLAYKARDCNGHGDNGLFVFDAGWSSEADAKNFVAELEAMGVWVDDIKMEDLGRCAWGAHRFQVSVTAQVKFCSDNVFGK